MKQGFPLISLVSQLHCGNYTSSNIYNIVLMPSAQAL